MEIIDLLISHPSLDDVASYINSTNRDENTALHMAKNVKIALKLLEKGADKTLPNKKKQTPEEVPSMPLTVKEAIQNYTPIK